MCLRCCGSAFHPPTRPAQALLWDPALGAGYLWFVHGEQPSASPVCYLVALFWCIRVCSSRKRRGLWWQARPMVAGAPWRERMFVCSMKRPVASQQAAGVEVWAQTAWFVRAVFPRQPSAAVWCCLYYLGFVVVMLSVTHSCPESSGTVRCSLPEAAALLPLHPDSHVSCAATWSLRSDGSWASVGITGWVGWRLAVGSVGV